MRKNFVFGVIFSSLIVFKLYSQSPSDNLMQSEIKHVVVLMLENRSFDNVLAWLYDENAPPNLFIAPDANPKYMGLEENILQSYVNTLKNSSGEIVFSCNPIKGIPSVANTLYLNSPKFDPHEPFPHVINQIYGFEGSLKPNMSGFLQDYASLWWEHEWQDQKDKICAIMETYTEQELPVIYGLAKHYAVSDLWFSSVPTQTNPNRAFSICGTSEGQVVNGPIGRSQFHCDTIWNRLFQESPQTSWTIFWQGDVLPGIFSGSYAKNTFVNLSLIPNIDDHFQTLDSFHEQARTGTLPDFSFIEPLWTTSIDLDPKVKLRSLLLGLQGNDLHPPGDIRTGENLLANIYTSLISCPEAWNETLLVITFDEHGGIYDHVPPPAAIPPDANTQNGFKFDQYGVRVPAIFISPRINKSTVVRSDNPAIPFDHTSLISTILKWKNIDKTKWNFGNRVAASPTFDKVIGLGNPRDDFRIVPGNIVLPEIDDRNVIHMGDKFYLKNKEGNYLVASSGQTIQQACLGSSNNKIALEFCGGAGSISHGSFVLVKSLDPSLGDGCLLETLLSQDNCFFNKNKHAPGQWWTIKSMDYPYVGNEIQDGQKIYIENQVYLDLFQYIPGRLAQKDGLFGQFLMTKPVTQEGSSDCYWVIEKLPE